MKLFRAPKMKSRRSRGNSIPAFVELKMFLFFLAAQSFGHRAGLILIKLQI